MTQLAPNRYDVVGSFLRPERLKEARAQHAAGAIDDAALTAIENECITELIEREKAAGLRFITDGEFRRGYWHLDFMWGFGGIDHVELERGYQFVGEETTKGSAILTGKITGSGHPFIEHFKFVQQFEDENHTAKQTVPAPAQLLLELYRNEAAIERVHAIYPDEEELFADIAAAYRTFIEEIYEAGCRNLQFDDCTWGILVDDRYWKDRRGDDFSEITEAEKYLRLNNLVLEGKPEGMVINTHVCRGNYHSTYASSGPYDAIAPFLFSREHTDAFYLEFDDERSGSFEPLKYVPEGKKVVLGLITTKRPELEDRDAVIARIHEAAQIVPLENLCLSPQCGFASLRDRQQTHRRRAVGESRAGQKHRRRSLGLLNPAYRQRAASYFSDAALRSIGLAQAHARARFFFLRHRAWNVYVKHSFRQARFKTKPGDPRTQKNSN